jgi:hypothetical protein
MGKNSISLPRWWGYSPPPGQQPKHSTEKTEKPNNHEHAPPDPLHSVELLLQEVSPARLFVVLAAGHPSLDMAAL